MNTFGNRIKHLRKICNLKQGDLSQILGISQGNLSEAESDKRLFSSDAIITLFQYSKEKNISIDWLLTGEGSPTPTDQPTEPLLSETEEMLLDAFRSADKTKRRVILQKALEVTNEQTPTEP